MRTALIRTVVYAAVTVIAGLVASEAGRPVNPPFRFIHHPAGTVQERSEPDRREMSSLELFLANGYLVPLSSVCALPFLALGIRKLQGSPTVQDLLVGGCTGAVVMLVVTFVFIDLGRGTGSSATWRLFLWDLGPLVVLGGCVAGSVLRLYPAFAIGSIFGSIAGLVLAVLSARLLGPSDFIALLALTLLLGGFFAGGGIGVYAWGSRRMNRPPAPAG